MALDTDYEFAVASDKACFQGQSLTYLMGFANYFTGITSIYSIVSASLLQLRNVFLTLKSLHLVIFSRPHTDVTGTDIFTRHLFFSLQRASNGAISLSCTFPGRNCLAIHILFSCQLTH